MPRTRLLLATAVAALGVAGTADAATYCVHQPGTSCAAGTVDEGADLQAALTAAQADADADTVRIAPGVYTPVGTAYDARSPLGTGKAAPPLTVQGDEGVVLRAPGVGSFAVLEAGSATVRRVRVEIPATGPFWGISSIGGAVLEDVTVTGSRPEADGLWVGAGTTIKRAKVELTGQGAHAVAIQGSSWTGVTDSELTAPVAIATIGATTKASIARVDARGAVRARGGQLQISDSTVRVPQFAAGLDADCYGSATLSARHVTVVGGPNTAAAKAACTSIGGTTGRLEVRDSILDAPVAVHRHETSGRADVLVSSTLLDPADVVDDSTTKTGTKTFDEIVPGSPAFVSALDLRPAPGSKQIDAASPLGLGASTDLAGRKRPVDGNGDGVATADLGALERQASEPGASPVHKGPAPLPASHAPVATPATGGTVGEVLPEAPKPPVVAAPPVVARPRSTSADPLVSALRSALRGGRVARRGGKHTLRLAERGTLRVTWKSGRKVVARGKVTRRRAGRAVVRMALTPTGRRVVRRGMKLTVSGTLTSGGRTVRATTSRRVGR